MLVLNGNGVGGSAANASYLLAAAGLRDGAAAGERLRRTRRRRATSTRRSTTTSISRARSAAANALAKLFVPADVGPLPKDAKLRALDPGAMLVAVVGRRSTTSSSPQPAAACGAEARAAERPLRRRRPGSSLLQPLREPGAVHARGADRARELVRIPTTSTATSPHGSTGSTSATTRRRSGSSSGPARGEYWGIEETNMPNPPVLADKSFQHDINGREFSALLLRLAPAHGRPARARPQLLGREHAARLALERDDDRDREGPQAAATAAGSRVSRPWLGWASSAPAGSASSRGSASPSSATRSSSATSCRRRSRRSAAARCRSTSATCRELLERNRERLTFTLDADELADCPFLFVCVDTPPTHSGDADLSRVWSVVDELPELAGRADPRDEVDGAGRDGREDPARPRRARARQRRLRLEPGVPRRGHRRARLHASRPDRDRRVRGGGRRRGARRSTRRSTRRSSAATSTRPR